MEGLDLERAMAQPETAYKVRHLKMGVTLAGVLCTCDSYTSFRMLVSREISSSFPLLPCVVWSTGKCFYQEQTDIFYSLLISSNEVLSGDGCVKST